MRVLRRDSPDEPSEVAGLLLELLGDAERELPEEPAARDRPCPELEPPDDALRVRFCPLREPLAALREPLPPLGLRDPLPPLLAARDPLPVPALRDPLPLLLPLLVLRVPPLRELPPLAAREALGALAARDRLPEPEPPPALVLREPPAELVLREPPAELVLREPLLELDFGELPAPLAFELDAF